MTIVATPIPTVEGADLGINHVLGFGGFVFLTFSGSYVTGGEVITAAGGGVGLKDPKTLLKRLGSGQLYVVVIPSRLGYTFDYDYSTDKVIVRQDAAAGAPSAELPAAAYPGGLTGLTGVNRVRALFFGR